MISTSMITKFIWNIVQMSNGEYNQWSNGALMHHNVFICDPQVDQELQHNYSDPILVFLSAPKCELSTSENHVIANSSIRWKS